MAAGQQKKRLNSPNYVTCNFQEQHRVKKKKNMESSQNLLNMRGHISLEWDDTQKRAVAKREQIGITWRDVAPFIGSIPQSHMDLADVISIPQEIFKLKNLTEVLSYEVWKTHLSEYERKVLAQFLPNDKEVDVDQAVRSLLTGESLHFGNPFLIWGDALCSGKLHPDAVLHCERCFKTNKRAYYSELHKYHKDILKNLQKLKHKWSSDNDREKDVIEKMWSRPPMSGGKSLTSHLDESSEDDPEENLGIAESCSWVVDEKAGIGDKESTQWKKVGKPRKRKGKKCKGGNSSVASGKVKAVANLRKEEMPHKLHVLPGSSANYMSYIKISRKQHKLVKTIKQSGDGIQSKSLNHVLGDIKSFPLQPYETFEEEERKKLHEHWLQLVTRDIPQAFACRGDIQYQRQQLKKSLEYEIADRVGSLVRKDEYKIDPELCSHHSSFHHQDEEESDPELLTKNLEEVTEREEHPSVDLHNCKDDYHILQSASSQPLQRIPSLNALDEIEPMVLYSEDYNQDILKQEIASSHLPKSLKKGEDVEEETSAKDVWQTVSIPDSYYPPPMSHGYSSVADLSLGQPPPIERPPARLIDLETDSLKHDNGQSLLQGSTGEGALHIDNRAHLFPFTNHDRTEVLSPFLKEQRMLPSYPCDHIKSIKQLEFLSANDCSPENGQFQQQFHEQQQQQLFEQRQVREKELYIQQIMQKNIYPNGRYPSQEFFPSVGLQDWHADPVSTAAFQPPIKTGMLGHNWYSGEQRTRNSWSGVVASTAGGQCLGQGGGNTDGSLFSVLSQCNSLQSHRAYSSMNSDLHIPDRNFISGNVSSSGDVLGYPHLNYLSSQEATATTTTVKENNASWRSLPPKPNSSLHHF